MKQFSERDLVAGDVLLYNGNGFISKAICFFDGIPYSHASLFLGGDSVGEAIAEGLSKRNTKQSFKDANYVLARRLISGPPDMTPVISIAERYLREGNRYGFEQILLLAFLTLTRRLKENKYLAWLVRKVLDQAAGYLMDHSDQQPMICSEFVFRCYDEAVAGQNDPYTLRVNTYPVIGIVIPGIRTLGAPVNRHPGAGLDQESLLAWAVRSRGSTMVTGASQPDTRKKRKDEQEKDDDKFLKMSLDDLIEAYLNDVTRPAKVAAAVTTPRTPEVLASIERFASAFRDGAMKRQAGAKGQGKPAVRRLPVTGVKGADELQWLLETVADFVTPGDLLKCGSLHDVGTIKP